MADSLSQMAEDALLDGITLAIQDEALGATYAIGGRIPIKTNGDGNDKARQYDPEDTSRPSNPIQIRFDEGGQGVTLVLPIVHGGSSTTSTKPQLEHSPAGASDVSLKLQRLLAAAKPASLAPALPGDLQHLAGTLDASAFLTSFCPYNSGIIDVVQQILPQFGVLEGGDRGVRAELCQLAVHSAPCGPLVYDGMTPSVDGMLGRLIVALPVEHEGGELIVRRNHEELEPQQVFDWSRSPEDPPVLHWASFDSDCEHEFLGVKSGHLITLTYDLSASITTGHLAGTKSALDPTRLPLYKSLSAALETPSFLPRGMILGVYLSHHYDHTLQTGNYLPKSLRGADMALYEIAGALNLKCFVRPLWVPDDEASGEYGHHSNWPLLGSSFQVVGEAEGDCTEDTLDHPKVMKEFLEVQEQWEAEKVVWLNCPKGGTKLPQAVFNDRRTQCTYWDTWAIEKTYAIMLIKIPPFDARGQTPPEDQGVFEGIQPPQSAKRDN